jgi:exosortase/archaeosortase family protein
VAYLSGKPNWYRVVLVASAIPVAMVANIARVIVTGLVMYYVDPNYAQGAWHTAEGMALMLGGLALLQLEMTVLNALSDVVSGGKPQSKSTTETTGADNRRGVVHGAQA